MLFNFDRQGDDEVLRRVLEKLEGASELLERASRGESAALWKRQALESARTSLERAISIARRQLG
jgi:hypothetical protein